MFKKLYALISIVIFLIPCVLSVFIPRTVAFFAVEGLKLCINSIVPSLFPFMVITQILSRTGIVYTAGSCVSGILSPLLGISRNLCGAVLIGAVGGFPNGAHAVGLAYKDGCCTKRQAERAVALCNNCSLIYICTIAGSIILGSVKAGLILLISEVLSVIVISAITRFSIKPAKDNHSPLYRRTKEKLYSTICRSITESGYNTLNMCSYIVFFYIISGLISELVVSNTAAKALVKGLLEMSGGVELCRFIGFPLNYVICSAILGFSGISVIFQVCDVCEKYCISAKEFVFSRLLNAVLMPLFTTLLLTLLPRETIYVSVTANTPSVSEARMWRSTILYSFLILFAVAYGILKTVKNKVFSTKQ